MHQAIASIIIDGKFQGSFLLEARQSKTIKRGGYNVGSFVFLSHPTDWCRRNLHLPTLIENLCLGEIIVNIRPAWMRRLQRLTVCQPLTPYKYMTNTCYPKQMTPRARTPLMTPPVLRVINEESSSTVANKVNGQIQEVYKYREIRPHTAVGSDSRQRFTIENGIITRGCHSFMFTLREGSPSQNKKYTSYIDDNGMRYTT